MSGGSLDYVHFNVTDAVSEIRMRLARQGDDARNSFNEHYTIFPKHVAEALEMIAHDAERTAKLLKEAEWYLSDDIGDRTFIENVNQIMGKNNAH
jgi:hypothetical protein